jgi:MFS transporter, PPP family, 3-phenylpropionic acid transporter
VSEAPRLPTRALAAWYFCYFASVGVAVPFLPAWLESQGRGIETIGWLIGCLTVGRIVAPVLCARLADVRGEHLRIVRIASGLALASFALVPLGEGALWQGVTLTLFGCLWSASLPLVESITLAGLADRPERYTRIRIGGSVGFIAAVSLGGAIADISTVPWLLASTLAGGLAATAFLRAPESGHHPGDGAAAQPLRLLNRGYLLVLAVSVFMQLAHGPYYGFFTVYLERSGYPSQAIAAYWSLGVLAEVTLFLALPHLARRFAPEALLAIAATGGVLRWALIASLPGEPLVLAFAQCLHAATFGVHHATAVVMVHRAVPRRHAGLAQALYSSLSFGLGGAIGAVLAGWLWEGYAPAAAFGLGVAASAVALGVVVASDRGPALLRRA